MSTLLMTLLERAAWIAGAVTLVIGAFAIARRLAVRFTGWRPAELSLPAQNDLPPPRLPGWFPRFCATGSAKTREPLGQAQVACLLARCVESATVWLIGLALVGSGLLNVWWYGVDLDVVPAAQQRHEFAVLAFLSAVITGLALIGVVWRMGVSIVAIGVLLSAYFSLLDQGTISRRAATEADLATCSIEIRMEDGTVGADVWANGVLLGQTPLTVTMADWRKLPKWLDAPTAGPDGREATSTRASRGSRWITCVVRPDRRWVSASMPEGVYFLWVEIGGEPLVSAHASQANVSFDGVQWMSSPILILGQSPRWLTALDRLLDQARVRDYPLESPDEWLTALHSFGEGGWRQAMRTAENEPSLRLMLDELLRRDIGLPRSISDDAAWAIFERLELQVTEAREYESESRIGRSLELLLPHLNPERLARYAAGVVDDMRWRPSLSSWDHRRRGDQGDDWHGERRFLTLQHSSKDVTHFRRRDQLARLSFLAHAVWKMDEHLDRPAGHPTHDNPIEQWVVPALWRRDLPAGYGWGELKSLAVRLGGSLNIQRYERLSEVWRQQRPVIDRQLPVQLWLISQQDNSEAAGRFWHEHSDETLKFADEVSLEHSQWQSESFTVPLGGMQFQWHNFSFLFADADRSADSVAARYWPRFRDRVAKTSWPPVKKLEMLWRYLIQLEPFSTPEMYVAAWRAAGVDLFLENELRLNDTKIATRLAYDKRKAIIAALTAEAQARLRSVQSDEARQKVAEREAELQKVIELEKRDNSDKAFVAVLISEAQARLNSAQAVISPRRVEELNEMLRQITQLERNTFASDAQIALQRFGYLDDKESAFESLADVMTREIPARPELLELLDSPDPKRRLLGARVIRTHPAPHIRPLLEKLLSDSDAEVQKFAKETQTDWQRLATETPGMWSTRER